MIAMEQVVIPQELVDALSKLEGWEINLGKTDQGERYVSVVSPEEVPYSLVRSDTVSSTRR